MSDAEFNERLNGLVRREWAGYVLDLDDITYLGAPGRGYLYIIHYINRVKVGISTMPRRRLADLQNAIGDKLETIWMIGPVYDLEHTERLVHNHLKEYRGYGEWFNTDIETAIKAVKRVLRNQPKVTKKTVEYDTGLSKNQISRVRNSPLSDEYHARKHGVSVQQIKLARGVDI